MTQKDTKSERHSMRMHPDDHQALTYWAQKFDMDKTEFLIAAMYHYIKWKNGDYDLPTAEQQRLNQLIDAMNSMIATNKHLEASVVNGFDAMLGIIRGDNYLVDPEEGDL